MVYVYLEGHDFNYEVIELIKLFYNDTPIDIIDNKALVDNQSLLIENRLFTISNTYHAETKIYKNGNCLKCGDIISIDSIDIKSKDNKKLVKLLIKQSIFEVLIKTSAIKAPWGVLTGIRPTKIVHNLIDKSIEENEIQRILLEQYKLSTEKTKLIMDIAKVERKVIREDSQKRFSLYISIPFCPTRCLYCSFPSNSVEKLGHEMDNYTEKLLYEIEKTSELLPSDHIDTVYIGGGTPTALSNKNLSKIINKISSIYGIENIKEFTVEAGRPDTINKETLTMLIENGVERISINPQTMCENTLKNIGRKHTSKDIISAYYLAKKLGFKVINMDIIIGLPGEEASHVLDTMKQIKQLDPDNLTVHTMAIKRASKLKENLDRYSLNKQQDIEKMLSITKEYSKMMNMHSYYMYRQKHILGNYENIGYSKPNKECIYNILMMEEMQTIIALGAGAVSKFYFPKEDRIERVANVKNLYEYINRVDEMILKKKKFIKTLT